jgi:putative peptidoglycan lipid II flippase
VLLEHGVAGEASGDLVASILTAFAIGLLPFSMFQLLLRASYATQDTRTPALVNVGAAAVNVGANLLLFFVFDLGVPGLALGHALSYVVASVALYVLLRRRIGALPPGSVGPALGRSAVAAGATALVAWGVAQALDGIVDLGTLGGQVAQLGLAVGAGVATFVLAAMLLGIEEVRATFRVLRGRTG